MPATKHKILTTLRQSRHDWQSRKLLREGFNKKIQLEFYNWGLDPPPALQIGEENKKNHLKMLLQILNVQALKDISYNPDHQRYMLVNCFGCWLGRQGGSKIFNLFISCFGACESFEASFFFFKWKMILRLENSNQIFF